MASVTSGAVQRIFGGKMVVDPILQVLEIKKIQSKSDGKLPERHRLIVSDGEHFLTAITSTQINDTFLEIYSPLCLLKVKEYTCNAITSGKKILIILNAERVGNPQHTIGSPRSIEDGHVRPGSAPDNKPQQFQQQGQNNQQQSHSQPTYNQQTTSAPQNKFGTQPNNRQPPNNNSFNNAQGGQSNALSMFPSSTKPKSAPMRDHTMGTTPITPIKSLTPLNPSKGATIKVRITNKSDIREWKNAKGSGKLFHVDLMDADGSEIRATCFNDTCATFHPMLKIDQVFTISKFQTKLAKQQFSIKNELELNFDSNTIINPCSDDTSFPKMVYNFVPIRQIDERANNDLVDVIGVVHKVFDVTKITTKHQTQVSKRNIILLDSSAATIDFTLWGAVAEEFDESNRDCILAVKSAKVSDFHGKTLGSISSTRLEKNPDIPEAYQLKGWYDNQATMGAISVTPITTPIAGSDRPLSNVKKSFAQIKDEKLGHTSAAYFRCLGRTIYIKSDPPPYYDSCSNPRNLPNGCNKKVAQSMGRYVCDKCNSTTEHCTQRYILSLIAADHTGSSWLSCFNDIAEKILGHTASELHQWKQNQEEALYEEVIQQAQFVQYHFEIRAKEENYNDETRVKCTVVRVEPVDLVQEMRSSLIPEIKQRLKEIPNYQQQLKSVSADRSKYAYPGMMNNNLY